MNESAAARVFKALADENRVRILRRLQAGEKCACHLLEDLHITQPTLSHHMKILCDARIVTGRREGKWMHYALCADGIGAVRDFLGALIPPAGEDEESCR